MAKGNGGEKIIEEIGNEIKKIEESGVYREAKEASSFVWDIAKTLFFVVAIAFLIRFYLIQPFYVEGKSMEPSFKDGEYLLIDEISYKFRLPARGDVIVFKPPVSQNVYQNYIKRIIALPDETIEYRNESSDGGYVVTKDDKTEKLEEPYLSPDTPTIGNGSVKLKSNEYWAMGDNRTNSSDSRVFGPINKNNITGRAWFFMKIKPWKTINFFGIKINIPGIESMGRIKKPEYKIDKLSLSLSNFNKNRDPEKIVFFS